MYTNVQTCGTIQITLKQEYGVYSHFTGHSKLVGLKEPVDVILMYTTLNKNKGILTFYRPLETGRPQGASGCYTDVYYIKQEQGHTRPVETGTPQGASRRPDMVYCA